MQGSTVVKVGISKTFAKTENVHSIQGEWMKGRTAGRKEEERKMKQERKERRVEARKVG